MSSAVGVVIRDATPLDARAIAEVHVASWRWAYRDDLPTEFLEGSSVEDRERGWDEWLVPDQAWAGTTSEHRFDCANVPIVRYVIDL